MSTENQIAKLSAWQGWALMLLAATITFLLGVVAASILQRREEAREKLPLITLDPWEADSRKWADNYPRQYASYQRTADSTTRTKYGGSFPRDYLEETPVNLVLFAGYSFATEYLQARGHIHSVEDVLKTRRISESTPATCWTCKSTDVPRLMNSLGPEKFYALPFAELKPQIKHPVGCLDCHEPNTMRLRITRPALREAFQRQGKDIDQASHQEMRSLVCAQCHIEYYFRSPGNYLTLPWACGMRPEDMDKYYAHRDFADWTHGMSKSRMIKIQHPDYELYSTGIHAYRNVACADCHMPYRTEGGVKFTNHHVQSPLLNIADSCGVCHRWPEEEIRRRVEEIQDKVHEVRELAESVLAQAHREIAAAAEGGASEEELVPIRMLIRSAQLRWDYVAASNSMGFHSPQEAMRILATALELAGECRVQCARLLNKSPGEVSDQGDN